MDSTKETRGESRGILGEGGIVWEMAASVFNDVFHNSEERHERASHCAYANNDALLGSRASARGGEKATQISY